ncbi:MAG: pilus assembly protein PilM [PVC group bacterium]|nr:pilus assembly protein PilM [PVC group bacterium]
MKNKSQYSLMKTPALVGLDIGSDQIKVMGLTKTLKGLRVKYIGTSILPSGLIENGMVTDTPKLAKIIQDLFELKGIGDARVVTAVWGSGVLMRVSKVPLMSDSEIKEALKAEINHYIIFAGSEKISDTYRLEQVNEEGIKKSKVLLGVVRKEIVDSYVQAIRAAGIDLLAIDIGSLAVMRALYANSLKDASNDPIILIIIERQITNISILKQGIVSYSHNAEIESYDILRAENFLSKLSFELKAVINYYQSEFGKDVGKVIMSADMDQLDLFVKDMQTRFSGINIEKGDFLNGIDYDQEALSLEERAVLEVSARAIGLALRAARGGDYPVNLDLLPTEEIRAKEFKEQIKKFGIALGVMLGVLFVCFIGIKLQIRSIAFKTTKLQKELNEPMPELKELLGIEKGTDIAASEIEKQKELITAADQKKWDELLSEIKKVVPKDIRLTQLSDREGKIVFKGEAVSQEAVFNFVRSLRGSGVFRGVKLYSSKDKKKLGKICIDFDIQAVIPDGL